MVITLERYHNCTDGFVLITIQFAKKQAGGLDKRHRRDELENGRS